MKVRLKEPVTSIIGRTQEVDFPIAARDVDTFTTELQRRIAQSS
jgi:hypothetical protein